MTTPRRSERLSKQFISITYTCQYLEVENQIKKITLPVIQSNTDCMTPEKKVKMVTNLVKIVNANMDLLKQYGHGKYDIMFKMLYKKSFDWIGEAKEKQIISVPEMTRAFKKFRKKYETSRYANWEFMRSLFNLDANIMFRIDSYM
jgi:hypothetical protein